jgi:hypothetical protein
MTFSDLRGLEFASWPRWGEPPRPPSHALSSRVQSVTDDPRQAPYSCLQERTDLPNRTPPTSPPKEPGSSRLEVSSSESVLPSSPNDRARPAPKHRMHPPSGPLDPRRESNARWDGSHCQLLLQSGRTVSASLSEPLPPPAEPSGVAPEQAPVPCRAPSRRPPHRCSPRSGVTTLARRPPRTLAIRRTLDKTSTSKLLRSRCFRLVPYRLDTPPPPTVARRRRWLDSEGIRSPSQRARECPVLQVSVGTPPRRRRRESILTDPAMQEARVPADRSEHRNGLPPRCSTLPAGIPPGSREIPLVPPSFRARGR